MCPNTDCAQHGVKRQVLGGCDSCGTGLVPWVDPDVPTIEQIAYIVCDVAVLEGKPVPRPEIERILRNDPSIHAAWIQRLNGLDWKRRLGEIRESEAWIYAAEKAAEVLQSKKRAPRP